MAPAVLGCALILMLLVRSRIFRVHQTKILLLALTLAIIAAIVFLVDESALILKLYPAIMNFSLLGVFFYTLIHPPSMIERIARKMPIKVSSRVGPYTRVVTMVWCGFFLLNGMIATLVAIGGSLEVWTVYNGLVSYAIMGLLIVVELIVRAYI